MLVNSMNAISHSYTIQPIITMNGDLLPKMLICLQELTGEFGPRVSNDLPNYPNIIIKCSKSGKLTKELVIQFNRELIKPLFNTEFIYIADSWSGQTDQEIYENIFERKCKFISIPPHCTSLIQPLDVYFFRFWKLFAKRMYNENILYSWKIDMKQRNNIIKIHAMIHNQFSSPFLVE